MKQVFLALVILLAIEAFAQGPVLNTVATPRAVSGQQYSFQLNATCYNPPCNWVATGSLPGGFSMSTSGLITGLNGSAFLPTPFSVLSVDKTGQWVKGSFSLGNSPNRSNQWPHTVKTVGIPYIWYLSTPEWLRQNFDVLMNGNPDLSAMTDSYPADLTYVDGQGWYAGGDPLTFLIDTGKARGWANYEDAFLHATTDYTTPSGPTWSGMDQFDVWDEATDYVDGGIVNPARVRNGILLYHNGAYTDISVGVYQQKGPYTVGNGDALFIGSTEPFDLININLAVTLSGGTASWSYWNGSAWTTLNLDQGDSTQGLTASGTLKFTPPATWQQTSVNSSHNKWWVRLDISGVNTAPQIAQITGDTLISSSASCQPNPCNARGWNATDPHRVNIGLGNLEYNPTPPANATARFRYQARATGYWVTNYLFGNPNAVDPNTGDVMMAQAKGAYGPALVNYMGAMGQYSNGIFFDNIGGNIYWTSNNSDLPAGKLIEDGYPQMFQQMTPIVQAALGNNFVVAANLVCNTACMNGVEAQTAMSLNENVGRSTMFGHYYYATLYMDPFEQGTHKRMLSFWDTYHFQAIYDPCAYQNHGSCPTYHYFDQGDQSPMHTLAAYLLGMNSNTLFMYNTQGYYYGFVDEVFVLNPVSTTLAEAVVADTNNTQQVIHVADGSSFQNTTGYSYVLKIGNDWISALPGTDANHYNFNTGYGNVFLTQNYPPGTQVHSAMIKHLAKDHAPDYKNTVMWTTLFPAMKTDFGQPDPNGFNGGVRGVWYTGAQIGGSPDCGNGNCPDLMRRDFTKALVLQRAMADYEANEWETPSKLITLPSCSACQWRRLHADGSLDTATTTVTLTGQESAIYLKVSN